MPASSPIRTGRYESVSSGTASVLEEELTNYRLKQNITTGHAAFEPLREGQHDDLLFALCLGVWTWERAFEKKEYISFPGEVLG